MIGPNGDGKSAVVTREGRSRKKKLKLSLLTLSNPHVFQPNWPQEPPFFKD